MVNQETEEISFRAMSAYELIEHLNQAFPVRSIILGETEAQAHRYAGRRDLIDELMAAVEMEREEDAAEEA
jgi:hypothetical protein